MILTNSAKCRGIFVLILSALGACGGKSQQGPAGGMPPPQVSIVTTGAQRLTLETELPGRLEASRIAQVRARAAGVVLRRAFREGGDVHAGELLFRIDPAPFQAAYDSASAAVRKAEANLAQASLKVKRYTPLIEQNAISRQEYDDALTAQQQAAADLASSRAARQSAALNLGYTTVTAPISGRIGRALVTEGALVGQGEATPLATVQQLDPIFVSMSQSSTEVMRLQKMLADGQLASVGKQQARVRLLLDDGSIYAQAGKLQFSESTVDESTGAILLRAEFPNPKHTLLPGTYVRARLEQAVNVAAITVPQQAVIRSPEGASVFVVGADNKVQVREVRADTLQGNDWVVSSGLKAGERVIVDGFQKVKPGAPVTPMPWAGPATAPAFATPSAAAAVTSAPAPAARAPAAASAAAKSVP